MGTDLGLDGVDQTPALSEGSSVSKEMVYNLKKDPISGALRYGNYKIIFGKKFNKQGWYNTDNTALQCSRMLKNKKEKRKEEQKLLNNERDARVIELETSKKISKTLITPGENPALEKLRTKKSSRQKKAPSSRKKKSKKKKNVSTEKKKVRRNQKKAAAKRKLIHKKKKKRIRSRKKKKAEKKTIQKESRSQKSDKERRKQQAREEKRQRKKEDKMEKKI